MLKSGSGNQAVDVGQGRSPVQSPGRKNSPTLGNCFRNREKALFKPLLKIALKPVFQLRTAFADGKAFNPLANLPEA